MLLLPKFLAGSMERLYFTIECLVSVLLLENPSDSLWGFWNARGPKQTENSVAVEERGEKSLQCGSEFLCMGWERVGKYFICLPQAESSHEHMAELGS